MSTTRPPRSRDDTWTQVLVISMKELRWSRRARFGDFRCGLQYVLARRRARELSQKIFMSFNDDYHTGLDIKYRDACAPRRCTYLRPLFETRSRSPSSEQVCSEGKGPTHTISCHEGVGRSLQGLPICMALLSHSLIAYLFCV